MAATLPPWTLGAAQVDWTCPVATVQYDDVELGVHITPSDILTCTWSDAVVIVLSQLGACSLNVVRVEVVKGSVVKLFSIALS